MGPVVSRRMGWILGAALALLLGLRAALPLAIELGAERFGSDLLGRRVEIGDVDLALLPGGLIVEGLAVGPLGRRGEPPPEFGEGEGHFTLARLTANLGWLGLLGGEVHIEEVTLVEPRWLTLRDASGELVPVLLPREPAEEDEPGEESGPGPALRLDLLTLERLDARFVNLARPDDLPLHLQLEELRVEGLERRGERIALAGIGLRAPSLHVMRDIDLTFAGGAPAAEAEAQAEPAVPEESAPAAPLDLRLERLDLDTGSFRLIAPEGGVDASLAIHAERVTLDRDTTFPIRVALGIEGGELALEGEAGASPPVFAGTLSWEALPLATLAAAAGELSPLRIDSGTSAGELRVDLRLGDETPPRVGVRGRLGVDSLALEDRDGALALGWADLDVGVEELALAPGGTEPPRLSLSRIALRVPRARVVRRAAAGSAAPPAEAGAAPPEPAPEPGSEPELSLAILEVTDGELEFVDETVQPVHRSRLVDLQVAGRGLGWPARRAESLTVSFAGPAEARFALDAAVSGEGGRAHLELDGLGLPAFSPYAAQAAGYWLEEGLLSVEADVAMDGRRTKLDSDLDLLHLAVSEVEPGSFEKEFGVSIGLGLALLRDPAGRIALPIRAQLGDGGAEVGVAAIVVSALRQAILGALTAPLKTAGLLLGGQEGPGGLRIEPVPMPPGSAAAAPGDLEGVVRLAGVLEARPGLALELRGSVAPEDDPALAEQILQEQVIADAELPPVDAGILQRRRLRGALEERARGGEGELDGEDREALERWIAAVEVPEERRERLADQRAEAVREALVRDHGVDARRVVLGRPGEGVPGVSVGLAPAKR